jgi:FkbM family methyltransferase
MSKVSVLRRQQQRQWETAAAVSLSSSSLSSRRRCSWVRWSVLFLLMAVMILRMSSTAVWEDSTTTINGKAFTTTTKHHVPSLQQHKASLRYMGNKQTNTGWNVDTLCLQRSKQNQKQNQKQQPIIVYGVGAGEDISWDIGMVEEYGATVVIIDPTEKAQRHVESVLATKQYYPTKKNQEQEEVHQQHNQQVTFLPQGLSHVTGEIVFALPANPDHVSMRAVSLMADTTSSTNNTTRTVKAPVRTLRAFMTQLGHEYLDVLKMDIEGAEYDVLEGLMRENFMPFTQLLVEYHDRFLNKKNNNNEEESRLRHDKLLRGLKEAGFVELWSQNGGQERGYIKERDLQYCADGVSTRSATIR